MLNDALTVFGHKKNCSTAGNEEIYDRVPGLRHLETMLQQTLELVGNDNLEDQGTSDASTITTLSTSSSKSSMKDTSTLKLNDIGNKWNDFTPNEDFTDFILLPDSSAKKQAPWSEKSDIEKITRVKLVNPWPALEFKEDSFVTEPLLPFNSDTFKPIASSSNLMSPDKPAVEEFRTVRAKLRKVARETPNKQSSICIQATSQVKPSRSWTIKRATNPRNPFTPPYQPKAVYSRQAAFGLRCVEKVNYKTVSNSTILANEILPIAKKTACAPQISAFLPFGLPTISMPLARTSPSILTDGEPRKHEDIRGSPLVNQKSQVFERKLQSPNKNNINNREIITRIPMQTHQIQQVCSEPSIPESPKQAPLHFVENATLAKYRNMMKMGLPIGAIKNSMARDGVDPSLWDSDRTEIITKPTATKVLPKDKYRRTRLHWEPHAGFSSNTLWDMIKYDPDIAAIRVDEEEFGSLFRSELGQTSMPTTLKVPDHGSVKIIDSKRANNGGIILARVKLSYVEIAHAIDTL
jgi:Subunit CCDC53 of WASH complex